MTLHILKVTDKDDSFSDPMYYTIKRLRNQVLNEWYDEWVDYNEADEEGFITKEQIMESDEKLFDFMDEWGYDVEFILTITKDDL